MIEQVVEETHFFFANSTAPVARNVHIVRGDCTAFPVRCALCVVRCALCVVRCACACACALCVCVCVCVYVCVCVVRVPAWTHLNNAGLAALRPQATGCL